MAIGNATRLASVGLLQVQPSQVYLITTESLCASAVTAFNTALPTDPNSPATSVFLLQAGPNRYVAFDPAFRSGEFVDLVVFDLGFHFKGQLEG